MLKERVKAQAKDAVQHAKIFGEKFARTNKYMHANKLWLHTVPTTDCEVVVIFPTKTDDAVLMWVLAKLKERLPELRVTVRHHAHTGTCGLYLSATSDCLLKGAENLCLRKPLKAEYGGGLKEFTCLEASLFEGALDAQHFLSSQERQEIIHAMLESLRAVEGDRLGKVKFVDNEPIVPKLRAKGVISKVFPLHKHDDLQVLKKTWVQAFFKAQPLDAVCDYFGVKIAIYFAWLGYYTQALLCPAIVGLLVTLFVDDSNQLSQDRSVVFVSICNITWASVILEVWKRKGSTLAYRWGTLDSKHELLEEPRTQYKGDLVVSSVSGKLQPNYPAWKRNVFRYFVTIPIILLCCIVAFASMYLILEIQEWVNTHIQQTTCPGWVGYIPKIILTVVISVSEIAFKKLAYWLNRKENYRLQSVHENQLILKLVTVQFINHFLALFYIAFILKDMTRLRNYLGTIFILRQLTGNFKESVLPYVTEKLKLYRMTYMTASKVHTDEETRRQEDILEDTNRQEDMSEGTKRQKDVSEGTKRQEDLSEGTKKQDMSEGTKRQEDVSEGTKRQEDVSEGTKRQEDVSEGTKKQEDMSEGTKRQEDMSESTKRQEDVSEGTKKQDMSESTKKQEDMSEGTKRQEDMSESTKRQEDMSEGTKRQDVSEGTKRQEDVSEGTKRQEDVSEGTKRQEDMSEGTKRQEDVSEGTKRQEDVSEGTKRQEDVSEGTKRQEDMSEGTKRQEDMSEGTKRQEDMSKDASGKSMGSNEEMFIITQAELESEMRTYEDTFDDYLEMVIQFGYVILFSSAFPLAGTFALINNIVEIRSDAFKLCSITNRPFGQRVENIGSWQQALEVMAVIGVIVNCALLGVFGHVGRAFPSLTPTGVILCIVVLEHVILAMKQGISMAIPDIPDWVSIEMAKLEYRRREALKKMEANAMHCAKESTSKQQEDEKKSDAKLKLPQQGKVWPSSMTDAAASFKLFQTQNDKAVMAEIKGFSEKPSQDKKCD